MAPPNTHGTEIALLQRDVEELKRALVAQENRHLAEIKAAEARHVADIVALEAKHGQEIEAVRRQVAPLTKWMEDCMKKVTRVGWYGLGVVSVGVIASYKVEDLKDKLLTWLISWLP